jgi:hypothetical protein
MKLFKWFITALLLTFTLFSCKVKDEVYDTDTFTVKLNYPTGYAASDSVKVTLLNTVNKAKYTALTDAKGCAAFHVPVGIYEVTATEQRPINKVVYNFNGLTDFTLSDNVTTDSVKIDLTVSKTSQLVIKELYNGGCQYTTTGGGTATFSKDMYVIIYNNSDYSVSLDNLCLGMTVPVNSTGSDYDYVNGVLSYSTWVPAGWGLWYFPSGITLQPGKQIVVALMNAINNTADDKGNPLYVNSINFANAEYYCTYDINKNQFYLASYYPTPATVIPTSHYLSGIRYSGVISTVWSVSNTSPAFFIFATQDVTPAVFAATAANLDRYNGLAINTRTKVPVDWVMDGIEVFKQGSSVNYKRLTAGVDAGYIYLTAGQGYTLYRNVDQTATEAIADNAGKIVYGYSGGTTDITDGGTDPSGIDAEASIKNGARIVYQDTNNSTNDFHERKKASLRN